jgi:predicted lipid carrier protein YhbT
MLPRRAEGLDEVSLHLHATDAPGEWVVTVGGGAVDVREEHGKADVALRGTAPDLYLLLWHRVSPEAVAVLGDGAALERFLARTVI